MPSDAGPGANPAPTKVEKYLSGLLSRVLERDGMRRYRFSVVIERDGDGYFARCPELQGCFTQGDTYEEALKNIEEVITLHVEDRLARGEEILSLELPVSLTLVEVSV